jgi:hypothetical protein
VQPQVKVTNISHQNGAGFGLWIAQRFIKPGESQVMPVAELPNNYSTLGNVLQFDFLQAYMPPSEVSAQMVQQMLDMQAALMTQMGQMQEKLNQQASQPQQVQYVPAPTPEAALPGPVAGVGAAHYIPAIGDVQSDIQISSTSSKPVDGKALKERLKKAKKG